MMNVTPDRSSEARSRIIAATRIGELLPAQPNLIEIPTREHFLSNVRFCLEHLADGNMSRFAAGIGIPFSFIHDWFAANYLLRLEHLSRLSTLLDISPVRLLTHPLAMADLDVERIRQVLREKTSHVRKLHSDRQVRSVLEKAACSDTAVSLGQLARQLGYGKVASLQRRNPQLCMDDPSSLFDIIRACSRKFECTRASQPYCQPRTSNGLE